MTSAPFKRRTPRGTTLQEGATARRTSSPQHTYSWAAVGKHSMKEAEFLGQVSPENLKSTSHPGRANCWSDRPPHVAPAHFQAAPCAGCKTAIRGALPLGSPAGAPWSQTGTRDVVTVNVEPCASTGWEEAQGAAPRPGALGGAPSNRSLESDSSNCARPTSQFRGGFARRPDPLMPGALESSCKRSARTRSGVPRAIRGCPPTIRSWHPA